MDRKEVLLRAAYDILKRCEDSYFVISAMETCAHYDEVDCDGGCLIEDIADELKLGEDTKPIPLDDTEEDD